MCFSETQSDFCINIDANWSVLTLIRINWGWGKGLGKGKWQETDNILVIYSTNIKEGEILGGFVLKISGFIHF